VRPLQPSIESQWAQKEEEDEEEGKDIEGGK
jgi:hypothetical protein